MTMIAEAMRAMLMLGTCGSDSEMAFTERLHACEGDACAHLMKGPLVCSHAMMGFVESLVAPKCIAQMGGSSDGRLRAKTIG